MSPGMAAPFNGKLEQLRMGRCKAGVRTNVLLTPGTPRTMGRTAPILRHSLSDGRDLS